MVGPSGLNPTGGQTNVGPLVEYHRAAILLQLGREEAAAFAIATAQAMDSRFAFPSRLDDIDALVKVLEFHPDDPLARALLGHWMYDKKRYQSAISNWDIAIRSGATPAVAVVVHRNLGIAAYNVQHDAESAASHHRDALQLSPDDPKLWSEFDQLCDRQGFPASKRLRELEKRIDVVARRDDLVVSFAHLLVETGRATEALKLLTSRRFQPWEGGEGQVLGAWDSALLSLSRAALDRDDPHTAVMLMESALKPPPSLGEGRHTLANVAEIHLVAGDADEANGDHDRAVQHWQQAAASTGDFTDMAASRFSSQTIFAVISLKRLGRDGEADALAHALSEWTEWHSQQTATIDFFATSLPSMLLFVDDPTVDRDRLVNRIRGQLVSLAAP